MKTVLHKSETRGHIKHSWLDTYHTFSFAEYYEPSRMHFGTLRVLNDDIIEGGEGFGLHPHDNMEIVTIPLRGALEHKDSMGNTGVIGRNEIQVMSAGTGIFHSEFNHNSDEDVNLLQIWVFPRERNVEPRYGQAMFSEEDRKNKLQTVVSPEKNGEALWLNQDAWFSLSSLDEGRELAYQIKKEGNGLYLFVIEGEVNVGGQTLNRRDGYGISEFDEIKITARKDSQILLMDIPMRV